MSLLSRLPPRIQSLLLTAPVMLLAIVCHECAHGLVSDRLGDPTPRASGRLTLNPLRHLDPVGTICLLFFHFGWAKAVPINPSYYRNRRTGLIQVSLAGPAANAIVAFLSLLVEGLLLRFANPQSDLILLLCQLCSYSAMLNIGLGLFNLIPIPPLDGSNVAAMLSPAIARFYNRFSRYWRLFLLLCLFTGILSRPLSFLNNAIMDGLWAVIRLILW